MPTVSELHDIYTRGSVNDRLFERVIFEAADMKVREFEVSLTQGRGQFKKPGFKFLVWPDIKRSITAFKRTRKSRVLAQAKTGLNTIR